MAINFPSTPSVDDSHTHLGTVWIYDGTSWIAQPIVDDTPVNGSIYAGISSNWAYDHENAADPHTVYPLDTEVLKKDGSVALTSNWDAGSFTITALRFVSDQTTGTAPFTVASTTVVSNLNADQVDGLDSTDLGRLATASEWTKTQNFNQTTLTDATTVAWNCESNQVCKVTLGANRTMGLPTNIVDGAFYHLVVAQDATGGRTLAWHTSYQFEGNVAPTLSTTALAVDSFTFRGVGTTALAFVGSAYTVW